MIKNITGNVDFIESLRGKKATFMLALSNTKTADIDGITQAGIPGQIYLTPTLDSEFLTTGEVVWWRWKRQASRKKNYNEMKRVARNCGHTQSTHTRTH